MALFSLHPEIMESHMHEISPSLACERHPQTRRQIFLTCFCISKPVSVYVKVKLCGFIPSLLVFFLFLLFLIKLILFSYATMLLRSWREISCHLEASYLWQLLSNPLLQDPTPTSIINVRSFWNWSWSFTWCLIFTGCTILHLCIIVQSRHVMLQNSPNFLLWKLSMGLNGIKSGI